MIHFLPHLNCGIRLGTDMFEFIYRPAALEKPGKPFDKSFSRKKPTGCGNFVRWAVEKKHLDHETAESARTMLSSFEGRVASELAGLNDTLRDITRAAGVEVVAFG